MSSLTDSESSLIRELFDKYGLDTAISLIANEAQSIREKHLEEQLNSILKLAICTEWFSLNLFSLLSLRDISVFDTAFTNHSTRVLWLKSPKLQLNKENRKLSNDKQIQWCTSKNIFYVNVEIETVFFGKTDITDNSLMSLSKQCKYLKSISISRADEITEQGISAICQNAQLLQKFHLNSSEELLTKRKFPLFNLFNNLGRSCPLLQCLELHGFDFSKEDFESFVCGCKLLKSIKISGYLGLPDEFLIKIGSNCHLLEIFDAHDLPTWSMIYGVVRRSNLGLIAFLNGCSLLRTLRIHRNLCVSDENLLVNVSQYCPLLEKISFIGVPTIDNELAELGKLKFLQEIDSFRDSFDVTINGICSLVNGGSRVDFCSINNEIVTRSVPSSSQHISFLKKIRLQTSRSKFLSAALKTIANHCPHLQCLELYDTGLVFGVLENNEELNEYFQYLVDKCIFLTKLCVQSFVIPKEIQQMLSDRQAQKLLNGNH